MILNHGYARTLKRQRDAKRLAAAHDKAREHARLSGRSTGREEARKEYEHQRVKFLTAPQDRRTVVIGAEPHIEVFRVALQPEGARRFDPRNDYLDMRAEVVSFRAVRKCWQAHTGQVVTWWTWEPMR